MKTTNLIKFLSAFADYNVEIDNYESYEPKYAVVDDTDKNIRLTDDYEALLDAIDKDLPVWDIQTGTMIQFGVYYHYGDTGVDELFEVFPTLAEAERDAHIKDKHVDSENYELGDYYFAKRI